MVIPVSPAPMALRFFDTPSPRRSRRTPPPACRPASFALVSIAANPRPEGLSAGLFRARDGVVLRMAVHAGPQAPRGTVLLLQGRGDFIEKYYEVVADLVARGFAVVTFDWRGQGGSQRLLADGSLNHLARFDDCVQDLVDLVDTEVLPRLPGPYFALAHSMGAAILLHALARWPGLVQAGVLTAPMIAVSHHLRPAGAELVARMCRAVGLGARPVPAPRRRAAALPEGGVEALLTSDPERAARPRLVAEAAPHLVVGRPTIGWVSEAFRACTSLRSAGTRRAIATPVLVVAGDDDRVVSTPAACAFAGGIAHGSAVTLPGCAHDVMMERDPVRDGFWRAFDSFVMA